MSLIARNFCAARQRRSPGKVSDSGIEVEGLRVEGRVPQLVGRGYVGLVRGSQALVVRSQVKGLGDGATALAGRDYARPEISVC